MDIERQLSEHLARAAGRASATPDLAEVELGSRRVRGRRRVVTGVAAAMLVAGAGGVGFGLDVRPAVPTTGSSPRPTSGTAAEEDATTTTIARRRRGGPGRSGQRHRGGHRRTRTRPAASVRLAR